MSQCCLCLVIVILCFYFDVQILVEFFLYLSVSSMNTLEYIGT